MPYELLANGVVALHLAFILFAVLGGLLSLRWRWCTIVHIPSVVWAALIEFMHWPCPLTPLENWLRAAAERPVYESGFMERYLVPLIYPPGLTEAHQVALGIALVALNLAIYVVVWRRARALPIRSA
jgi:hypothetical protein